MTEFIEANAWTLPVSADPQTRGDRRRCGLAVVAFLGLALFVSETCGLASRWF